MQGFNRIVNIDTLLDVWPLIEVISEVSGVGKEEIADLFGLMDYSEEEPVCTEPYDHTGVWKIHIEDTFDRAGTVEYRQVERYNKAQSSSELIDLHRQLKRMKEKDSKITSEVYRLYRSKDDSIWDIIDKIDPYGTVMKRADILTRTEHLLYGNPNPYFDYTNIPGVEWYE